MATLFYLLGVICFLHEITVFNDPKSYLEKARILEKLNKKEDGIKPNSIENLPPEDKKRIIQFVFFLSFYLVWTIIGILFAGQWNLFLYLFGFGLMIGFFRRRNKNNTRVSLKVIKFDAFVSSIFLAFIILNHFHHIF